MDPPGKGSELRGTADAPGEGIVIAQRVSGAVPIFARRPESPEVDLDLDSTQQRRDPALLDLMLLDLTVIEAVGEMTARLEFLLHKIEMSQGRHSRPGRSLGSQAIGQFGQCEAL